jgi:SAM-dependent methyltransferase
MTSDTKDVPCPICGTGSWMVSQIKDAKPDGNHGWNHDAFMLKTKMEQVDVSWHLCRHCLYYFVHPCPDTSVIYDDTLNQLVAEQIKKYGLNPDDFSPHRCPDNISAGGLFKRTGNELDRLKTILAALEKANFAPGETITMLDYGGGDGFVSKSISQALEAVSGRKVNSVLHEPRPWSDDEGNVDDANHSGSCDVVLLLNVLEHTNDPVSIIKSASSFLKPGGVLIIEQPDERLSFLGTLRKPKPFNFHVSAYCKRSLIELLGPQAGMSVFYCKTGPSYYRGNKTRTIVAAATPNAGGTAPLPSRFSEAVSLSFRVLGRIFS